MKNPNLEALREMCFKPMKSGGRLGPKHRKSAEECWEGISKVAFQYWMWITRPWIHATPKESEKEWDDVATSAMELMNALRRLSTKSLEIAWEFNKQVAKKGLGDLADAVEQSWFDCDGSCVSGKRA
jgi:hypothetical protein